MSKFLAAVYLAVRFLESPDIVTTLLTMNPVDVLAFEVLTGSFTALTKKVVNKFRK